MAYQVASGRAVRVEQRVDREHDPDLDVHIGGPGLPGEAFHEGVGEDLIAGAAVGGTGRDQPVSMLAQRRQTGHTLLDRK